MINNLTSRKIDNFNFAPNTNVLELAREVVDSCSLITTSNLEVKALSQHNQLNTKLHPRNLQSILTNIILNGIDAINERGISDGLIQVILKRNNNWLSIKIRNNGVAIDKSDQDKIFDYGYTTKPHHSGLGLFKTVQILKFASGNIKLTHSTDDYTEFEVAISAV